MHFRRRGGGVRGGHMKVGRAEEEAYKIDIFTMITMFFSHNLAILPFWRRKMFSQFFIFTILSFHYFLNSIIFTFYNCESSKIFISQFDVLNFTIFYFFI